jgi:four helix bundle protein
LRCAAISGMSPSELLARAERALAVRSFYRRLPKSPDAQIPGTQVYKAASAMPANYRAARRGRSRAEFIAKLGTVVEESDETIGWLEHMNNGEIAVDAALLAEARELCAIFTASLKTARRNQAKAMKANHQKRGER